MTSAPDASRTRILVIDDDAAIRKLLERIIAGLGYHVRTTPRFDPSDIDELKKDDFVFVDMMMPGTDGIQVLDALSRSEVKSSIVLMSGTHREVLTAAETIAKRSHLNVTGVLNKPFRPPEIQALLSAKRNGEGKNHKEKEASEVTIMSLERAIERDEIDVHLQPIVDLQSNRLVAYEALARWPSPMGMIGPPQFIPVAAKNGVLPRLTQQILRRSLGYASELKAQGLVGDVWVNFGGEDFTDEGLPEAVSTLLAERNLPPGSLTIEVTESSATANEVVMLGILTRLRLKDINLAIDDFGTSYSGLERLSVVPFSFLKIDKHFVSGLLTNSNARTIVESSITLAKRLNLRVVGEGVETVEQFQALKRLGCDYAQGYHISKPMNFTDVQRWARLS